MEPALIYGTCINEEEAGECHLGVGGPRLLGFWGVGVEALGFRGFRV